MFRIPALAVFILLCIMSLSLGQYLGPELSEGDWDSPMSAYDLASNADLACWLKAPRTGRRIDENGNLVDKQGNIVTDYFTDLQRYLTCPTGLTPDDNDPEKFNLALGMAVDWTRNVIDFDLDDDHHPETDNPIDLLEYMRNVYGDTSQSLSLPSRYEYLSPTLETQFSKDLAKLVFELDYDPVKIYQWVYENVEFENYELSRKGALATYRTRRGNEWDQCSLLIALLRMSGIPTRYVYAGGKQYNSLPTVVFENDPATPNVDESVVNEAHKDVVMVQAWLNTGPGMSIRQLESTSASWVTLVPWNKTQQLQHTGIDLFPEPGSSSSYTLPSILQNTATDYLSPASPDNLEDGLYYAYYEGDPWSSLPNFSDLEPVATGKTTDISLNDAQRADYFGMVFWGYIELDEANTYTFYTTSDDGSRLFIDGQLVVDNDGTHGAQERSGSIELSSGYHEVVVQYFEYNGGNSLQVQYQSSSISKQQVPSSLWKRRKPKGPQFIVTEVDPYGIDQGINYSVYSGSWSSLPDFSALTPSSTGVASTFHPNYGGSTFGVKFSGYIEITEPGNYIFYTYSDDGSKLWLDGNLIVNNDGRRTGRVPQPREIGSSSVYLEAGFHGIEVGYFQYVSNKVLSVRYQGPSISKQDIPASVLWRDYVVPEPVGDENLNRNIADAFDDHKQQTSVEYLEKEIQDYIISTYPGKSLKDVPVVRATSSALTGFVPTSLPLCISEAVGGTQTDQVGDDVGDFGDDPNTKDEMRSGVEFNLVGAPLFYPNVLEGWWRANGTTAGSAPIDITNKWNGTPSTTDYKVLVQGWESNAFIFSHDVDGDGEVENQDFYVKLAEPGVSSGFGHDAFSQRTISMFVNIPKVIDENDVVLVDGGVGQHVLYEEGDSTNGLAIRVRDNVLEAQVAINGETFIASHTIDEQFKNSWHHISFIFYAGPYDWYGVVKNTYRYILYVDGAEVSGYKSLPGTFYSSIPIHSDGAALGARYGSDAFGETGTGDYFVGYIDHVQVYNIILSEDQISAISGRNQLSRMQDDDKRLLFPQLADRRLTIDFSETQYDSDGDGTDDDILVPVMQLDGETFEQGEVNSANYSLLSDYYRVEYRYDSETSWKRRPFIGAYLDSEVETEPRLPFINISFDGLEASADGMKQQIAELDELSPEDSSSEDMQTREGYLGRVSDLLAQTFQYRLVKNTNRVDELLNVDRLHADSTHNISIIWTFRDHSTGLTYIQKVDENGDPVTDGNGEPVMVASTHEASAMGIHAGWRIDSIFTLGKIHKTVDPEYLYDMDHPLGHFAATIAGHSASYNEGRIFEDWQGTPALSTVSGIFMAIEDPSNAVVTFTADDWENEIIDEDDVRSQLALDDDIEDKIIGDLKSGGTVTTPTKTVSIVNPDTGEVAVTSDVKLVDRDTSIEWAFSDFGGGQSDEGTDEANYIAPISVITFDASNNSNSLNHVRTEINGTLLSEALNTEQVARTVYVGGDPVDMVTGEFYLDEPADMMIRSRGLSLGITRKYRSQAIYDGPFGYGWTWNHSESLLIEDDSNDIIFYNAERRPHKCVNNGDGTYTVPRGNTFKLVELLDGETLTGYEIQYKDGSAIRFATDGLLFEKRDMIGNKLTFTYDADSRITEITDAIGRSIELTYTDVQNDSDPANDKITLVKDFSDRSVSYGYTDDDLTSFTDAEGNVYSYEYLSDQDNDLNNHNLSKQILPDGDYLEIHYYKNDTVSHHTNKIGNTFHFQYSWLNRYTETWSEKGYYRKVFYNPNWDVIRIETEDKAVEFSEYDIYHNMISHTDGNGNKTVFRYDGMRNLLSTTNALGQTWVFEYESTYNKRTAEIDPKGVVSQYEYTAEGLLEESHKAVKRVAVTTDAEGLPTHTSADTALETFEYPVRVEKRFEYDAFGNLLKDIHILREESIDEPQVAAVKEFVYDANSVNVIEAFDPEGNRTQFGYDVLGRVVSVTDPVGNITHYAYNANDQKIQITDAAGNVTVKTYDDNSRLVKSTDPRGAESQIVYGSPFYVNHYSRVMQEIDPLTHATQYAYDEVGNRIQATDRNGNVTYFAYDELGRLIKTTDALGNFTTHRYDANGNRIQTTDARGNIVAFEYDAANRKTLTHHVNPDNGDSVIHPANQRAAKKVYDLNGNVVESIEGCVDSNGDFVELFKNTFEYDARNRRIKAIANDNDQDENERITEFTYDAFDRLIEKVESDIRKTTYTYDLNGKRLSEQVYAKVGSEWELQRTLSWQYNSRQLVSKTIDGNGVAHTYTYDALGRQITDSVDVTNVNGITKTNTTKTTYDAVGNVIRTETFVDNTRVAFSEYTFNMRNEQSTATNALGYTTHFEYDPNGNRTGMTDPEGATTSYYFDALNRTIAVEDALGNTTSTQYDAVGNNLATVTPMGDRTTFAYNRYNQAITVTDPLSHTTTYGYDDQGRRINVTNARGHTTDTTYTVFDEVHTVSTDVTLADGLTTQTVTTTNTYDDLGRLIETENANGTITRKTYDVLGRVTELVQADAFRIDPKTVNENPAEQVSTTYAYDANGNRIREIRAEGTSIETITESTYDQMNRLIRTIRGVELALSDPGKQLITTTLYDDENRQTTITDPYGMSVITKFDLLGRKVEVVDQVSSKLAPTDPEYKTTTFTYNKRGNLTMTDLPVDMDITNEYDTIGRLTKVTQNGDTRTVTYDANSRVIQETDFNGNITQQFYDAASRRIRQVQAVGTPVEAVTKFAFDAVGNLVKIVNARHADKSQYGITSDERITTAYCYDELNRRIFETDSLEAGTPLDDIDDFLALDADKRKSVTYDANGNAVKTVRRDGSIILREFDALNRLTLVAEDMDQDGIVDADVEEQKQFTYDLLSRMTQAVDYNRHDSHEQIHTVSYNYDFADRVTQEESYDSLTRPTEPVSANELRKVVTEYGAVDEDVNISQAITRTYPSGRSFTLDYDQRGSLGAIWDNSSTSSDPLSAYGYDDQGRLNAMTLAEPDIAAYRLFDTRGRESDRSYVTQGGSGSALYTQTSAYDANGNLIGEDTSGTAVVNVIDYDYQHDEQNRLTDRDNNDADPDNDYLWQYDKVGNWTGTNQGTTGGSTNIVTRTVNDDNEYAAIGSDTPTYDDRGNLTGKGAWTYVYDWANRLVETKDNGTTISSYTYDARNRRVSKYVNATDTTTLYAYAGSQVVQEFEQVGAGTVTLERSFVYGLYIDEPVAMIDETTTTPTYYYYLRDRRASVVALIDATGTKVETYEYTAFGLMTMFDATGTEITTNISTINNPYGFTGRRWDTETELWYYRNRMYSAELGRFLQRDPLGYIDGYNMYAYVSNRPFFAVDPRGLQSNPMPIMSRNEMKYYETQAWFSQFENPNVNQPPIHTLPPMSNTEIADFQNNRIQISSTGDITSKVSNNGISFNSELDREPNARIGFAEGDMKTDWGMNSTLFGYESEGSISFGAIRATKNGDANNSFGFESFEGNYLTGDIDYKFSGNLADPINFGKNNIDAQGRIWSMDINMGEDGVIAGHDYHSTSTVSILEGSVGLEYGNTEGGFQVDLLGRVSEVTTTHKIDAGGYEYSLSLERYIGTAGAKLQGSKGFYDMLFNGGRVVEDAKAEIGIGGAIGIGISIQIREAKSNPEGVDYSRPVHVLPPVIDTGASREPQSMNNTDKDLGGARSSAFVLGRL